MSDWLWMGSVLAVVGDAMRVANVTGWPLFIDAMILSSSADRCLAGEGRAAGPR